MFLRIFFKNIMRNKDNILKTFMLFINIQYNRKMDIEKIVFYINIFKYNFIYHFQKLIKKHFFFFNFPLRQT